MDSENHPLFSPSRVRREFCAIILPVSRITGDIRIEFPPLCIRAYQLKAFRISSAGMNYKFLFIKPRIVSLKSRTYYPRRNSLCCVRACVYEIRRISSAIRQRFHIISAGSGEPEMIQKGSQCIPRDICILLPVEKINLQSRETISQSTAYAGTPAFSGLCEVRESGGGKKQERKEEKMANPTNCLPRGWLVGCNRNPLR